MPMRQLGDARWARLVGLSSPHVDEAKPREALVTLDVLNGYPGQSR